MTEIQISADELERRLAHQDEMTDQLDRVLNGYPGPVDAGAASEFVAVLFQAAVEGATNLADTHRALIAVARDVCQDLSLTDSEAAAVLNDIKQEF